MVVEYSETKNKYFQLNPLYKIGEAVNSIAKYKVFSNTDLRSGYHQVPLAEEDRPFTAFEAYGKY